MKKVITKSIITTIASSALLAIGVYAQTETTTTTIITKEGRSVVLPSGTKYVFVDPLTGAIRGDYNPVVGLTDVSAAPGAIIIDQVTGRTVATIDASGKPIDLLTVPAYTPLLTAIDSRRNELYTKINDTLNQGLINSTQADSLQADLRKITGEEDAAKSAGGVSYNEALSLAVQLNNLSDRLVVLTHAPAITPLVSTRFVGSDGQVVMVVNDTTYRRLRLRQRIDDEYAAGRLSNTQVSELKSQLDSIAALESKYTKNGHLEASKTQKISERLDRTEKDINKDVAIINDKRAKIGIKVQ